MGEINFTSLKSLGKEFNNQFWHFIVLKILQYDAVLREFLILKLQNFKVLCLNVTLIYVSKHSRQKQKTEMCRLPKCLKSQPYTK